MLNSVVAFVAAICLCAGFAIFGGIYGSIMALTLLPVMVCLFAVIIRGDRDYFSPLHLLLYMTFIGGFLKAGYLLYLDTTGQSQVLVLAGHDYRILNYGAIGLGVAVVCSVIGVLTVVKYPRRTDLSAEFARLSTTRMLALAVTILSPLILYFFIRTMNIGDVIEDGAISTKRIHLDTVGNAPRGAALGYLRMGAQTLPQVALFLHMVNMAFKRREVLLLDWFLVLFLACLSLTLPFLTSSRLEMVFLILACIIIYNYSVKRVSVAKGVAAVVAIMVIIAFLGQLRLEGRGGDRVKEPFSVSRVAEATLGKAYFMDIGKTSVVIEAVPDRVDFLNGQSFALFLLAPIPRTFWPEKPAVRIGLFVGQYLYLRNSDSGVPPGIIGELYMNFGWPGVVLGMLLFGVLYGKLYMATIVAKRSPMRIVIFALGTLFFSVTLLSADFTAFMSQIFRYGVPLLFFLLLRRMVEGRRRAGPAPVFPDRRQALQRHSL